MPEEILIFRSEAWCSRNYGIFDAAGSKLGRVEFLGRGTEAEITCEGIPCACLFRLRYSPVGPSFDLIESPARLSVITKQIVKATQMGSAVLVSFEVEGRASQLLLEKSVEVDAAYDLFLPNGVVEPGARIGRLTSQNHLSCEARVPLSVQLFCFALSKYHSRTDHSD